MRICHCQTDVWKKISDENEFKELMRTFEFENSQITEFRFQRSAYIHQEHASQQTFIPDALFITFDNRIDIEKMPGVKRIEMIFGNVDRLNFCPENLNDIDTLDTVEFRFADGFWYFGDVPYKEQNKYGYCDDATWLRCDSIFWRKLDYSIDI